MWGKATAAILQLMVVCSGSALASFLAGRRLENQEMRLANSRIGLGTHVVGRVVLLGRTGDPGWLHHPLATFRTVCAGMPHTMRTSCTEGGER